MDDRAVKPGAAPANADWGSPLHVHALVLMIVTAIGVYCCYLLARPMFPALAWALALVALFAKLHRWIESKVKHRDLAATISIVLIALIAVVPAIFVADQIISEASRVARTVNAMVESGSWRRILDERPGIASFAQWIEQNVDVPGVLQASAAWVTELATAFVRGSILQLIGIVLVFYVLFYFLRDRRIAIEAFRSLSPLPRSDTNYLFAEVFDTVRATVYGTFAVAAVQGLLGGLMFMWLGLPEPLLWGVVMALLAVVPVLGAFIVWIPAAIFLVLEGSGLKALLLTVWGAIVVGGIDNLLYPILVGRRLKMHSLVAFVSIVGGLIVLGPSGLILGPVVFTVTRVLLQIWSRRNAAAAS